MPDQRVELPTEDKGVRRAAVSAAAKDAGGAQRAGGPEPICNGRGTSGDTLWTFQGDGNLSTPPVIVDDTVVTASTSGTVYALSVSSGNVVWTGNAGTSIVGPDEQNANQLAGLGVGEGWLVVPAGSTLVAWKLVP